jgi:cobalt/nickel transport system ATP-binding protein
MDLTGAPLLVEVRGLEHRYPDGTHALRGVDFELRAGETVALLGPNGSGKTTFALHLPGLLSPAAGEIRVCGMCLSRDTLPAVRRAVGFVFQNSDEQLFMPTVLEDVAFGLLARGPIHPDQARSRALAALERTGMRHAAGRAPYHLSAGEKRRVAVAGALVCEPQVLILDEPTTFLDPPGRRDLLDVLRALPQAKLLITHDVSFAHRLAHRAVFFQAGAIAGHGPVGEVAARFGWSDE